MIRADPLSRSPLILPARVRTIIVFEEAAQFRAEREHVPDTAAPEPKLLPTFGRDVRDVVVGVKRAGFKATVRRTFSELENFYLSTHRQTRLAGMRPARRWLFLTAWLLKSLYLKLTPSRRVLLLIAFFLMWQSSLDVSREHFHLVVDYGVLGVIVLILILMMELKDKLLARSELEAGRTVQLALMPDRAPVLAGWDVWLYTRSANDVGGDLVDYLQIDPRRLGVMLGDVAGKGLPAALLMAKLQATLRALASGAASLGDLGGDVNRILNRDGLPNRFATLVYLEITPDSGHVRLLNAGHMPPLVVRHTHVEEMPTGSIALGMVAAAAFAGQEVDLQPEDMLVVYSDGITEAMNATEDFFGDERLRAAASAAPSATAAQAGARILAAVDAFVGDAAVHDDISLALLKRVA
jgi:sigma-B regulation protein RsbU (phosphoserine phosphatase)